MRLFRLFVVVKHLSIDLGWKLIWGRLLSLLGKKFLSKGEKKYINGKIILIEEGREYYKGRSVRLMYFVPIYYCEDGQRRRSEPIYDGINRMFTDISREKVGIGTTGALILRVDEKERETVTGFLPGFDADTGQVTSSKTDVVSYQSKYM